MTDNVPPRVLEAEERARFRELLGKSSLGTVEVKEIHARLARYLSALPDRWVTMPIAELERLLDVYRERRETWSEGHEEAVTYVLAEVDYEPDETDLEYP